MIKLNIKDPTNKMILIFVRGLHHNFRYEFVMFPIPILQEACRLTSNIESRRKASTSFQGKGKLKANFIPSSSTISSKGKKRSNFDS